MFRNILTYGAVAGAVVSVLMFISVSTLSDHSSTGLGMILGYASMLIALSALFVGVKHYRDTDRGGVIGFWQAFGMGLAISVVAGVIYALAWEVTLAVLHWDFAGEYGHYMIAHAKAKGVSGAALQKVIADANAFMVQYRDPLFRLPMTFVEFFPVGAVVSLIVAALLRNSRFLPARG